MFVFAADLHLAPGAWVSMPQLSGDSYRSFNQIIDFCVRAKHECKALVLGGDVFDAQPPSDAVATFLRGLEFLKKAGIPVLAIQGQHGWAKLPWPSVDPYVTDLNQKLIELEPGVRVFGLDHRPPQELKEALEAVPKDANVLVLHQMVRGCVPDIEGRQNWDLDPEWIPEQVKLTLLGDFHQPWTKVRSNASEMLYSGSTQMQSVDEPAEKSFVRVHSDLKWGRIPLATRPFRSYTISSTEMLAEAIASVKELEPDTLVLVRYDATVPNVVKELEAANDQVHLMPRIYMLPAQNSAVEVDLEKLREISLRSCLDLAVKREDDPELHSFVAGLLEAKDPKAFLEGMQTKMTQPAQPEEVA